MLTGRLLTTAIDFARELLFPRTCLSCQRLLDSTWRWLACEACLAAIGRVPPGGCDRCGHPCSKAAPCATCRVLHPALDVARSWCWADDPVARSLLHALKYDGWSAAAGALAYGMRSLVPDHEPDPRTCLVPVPLAPGRRRERGYNQAELLAEHLARLWQCALIPDAIERLRETPSQTRLTRTDRFANVAGAFQVNAASVSRLRRTRCVLVDDVMTTGATLNACATALDAVGVESIAAVTFGRARDPRASTPA
jgi:ComF family protein